jgi:hypothetical protein
MLAAVNLIVYICSMIKNQFVSASERNVDFEYCWVYPDKYKCIDASFLNLNGSRTSVVRSIKVVVYRLMAINPEASAGDISLYLKGVLRNFVAMGGKTCVLEFDLSKVVDDVFSLEDVPEWLRASLYSYKKVLWKSNISDLIQLTDNEKQEMELIKDEVERTKYKVSKISEKKRNYASKAVVQTMTADMMIRVVAGLESIMETPECGEMSIQALSDLIGIHRDTLVKYLHQMGGNNNKVIKEAGILKDKRELMKERTEEKIIDTCNAIHERRELVNKIKLHKEAVVSRPTIDKKWDDEEFRLKDYVDGLNQQITT